MRGVPWIAIVVTVPSIAAGQDTARSVTVGGFVDAYYAWDVLRPAKFDRSFTTQPARHNEFNVNLAFVEMKLAGAHTRGRVALQAGTSVQANYAAEPRVGIISGPDLSRHIQEAPAYASHRDSGSTVASTFPISGRRAGSRGSIPRTAARSLRTTRPITRPASRRRGRRVPSSPRSFMY